MMDQQAALLQSSLIMSFLSGKFKMKKLWVILVRFIFNCIFAVRSKANTFFFLLKKQRCHFLPGYLKLISYFFPFQKKLPQDMRHKIEHGSNVKKKKKYNFKTTAPQKTLTVSQGIASGCPSPQIWFLHPLSGLELFEEPCVKSSFEKTSSQQKKETSRQPITYNPILFCSEERSFFPT